MELFQAGQTSYLLLVDGTAPKSVQDAADEFTHAFHKATGVRLQRTSAADGSGPFISLGENALTRRLGIGAGDLPIEGYRIVTREPHLLILGRDTADNERLPTGGISTGTLYGVYDFLETHLGVRWLGPGELGEDIPTPSSVRIPDIDLTSAPASASRRLPYVQEDVREVRQWLRRQRQGGSIEIEHRHNWVQNVPPELYAKHPEWFAEINGRRVAPVGRYKLETTDPGLVAHFADRAVEAFAREPARWSFSVSPSDSRGWSESAQSRALYEKTPDGELSITPLILSFYNNVARLVGPRAPGKVIGGYVYSDYLYPPTSTMAIEPNLFLVVAPSFDYGYTLYRPDVQKRFELVMQGWSRLTRQLGYYDCLNFLKSGSGVPTAPGLEILAYVYPRLGQYGLRHVYMYGDANWGTNAIGNYIKAKLSWRPDTDVNALADEFCVRSYGPKAGPIMRRWFDRLDASFKAHYQSDPQANVNLTPAILKGAYAPVWDELVKLFLEAKSAASDAKHQQRLAEFEKSMVMLEWTLRSQKLIAADTKSPFYRTDQQIQQMVADPANKLALAASPSLIVEPVKVNGTGSAPDAAAPAARIRGPVRIVLYSDGDEEVRLGVTDARERYGDITVRVRDSVGQLVAEGKLENGKPIRFSASGKQTYLADVQCANDAIYIPQVSGAGYMVRGGSKRLGQHFLGQPSPLYFHVPAERKFTVILSSDSPNETTAADLVAPDGKVAASLDTSDGGSIRIETQSPAAGFWKLAFKKPRIGQADDVWVKIDGAVSPWIGLDGKQLLIVEADKK